MNEIRNWKRREQSMNESAWLSEGIEIHRRKLVQDPENVELKADFAKLLVRSGTDEKLKYVNMDDARRLFEEVLEIIPDQADALYRLGHVCFELDDYQRSVDYFPRALKLPMSEIRKIRSFTTLSKAYFLLGETDLAKSYLDKAEELDSDRNFTGELKEAKLLFSEEYPHGIIVQDESGETSFLTHEAADAFIGDNFESKAFLDWRSSMPSFSGPANKRRLESKEADILKYLFERKERFVSMEELINLWEEGEKPEPVTIKAYISKIRKKVKACLPQEYDSIIENKRNQGYRWVCAFPLTTVKEL